MIIKVDRVDEDFETDETKLVSWAVCVDGSGYLGMRTEYIAAGRCGGLPEVTDSDDPGLSQALLQARVSLEQVCWVEDVWDELESVCGDEDGVEDDEEDGQRGYKARQGESLSHSRRESLAQKQPDGRCLSRGVTSSA